jgi:hypothetical protein
MDQTSSAFNWLEASMAIFTAIAAVAATWAVVIAVRSLVIAREATAVDQLFGALADVLAELQEVARLGVMLSNQPDGEARSRDVVEGAFQRFLGARARVDLAAAALGLRGPYIDGVLDVAHNFAVNIRQADEFGPISREIIQGDDADRSWVRDLSWSPNAADIEVLAKSLSFLEVRQAMELVDPAVTRLRGLDRWWAERIVEFGRERDRNVYSIYSSYLVQDSRLLADFTREYVQPAAEKALHEVSRTTKRLAKPLA